MHIREQAADNVGVGAKLAVQGRHKLSLFLCVLSRSLQGIAERPLPCNYNVIRSVSALSRRLCRFYLLTSIPVVCVPH